MKIVRLAGGLGNQMFEYSFYLSLKEHYSNESIYVDYSLYKGYRLHNGLELNKVFSVELPQASFFQLLKTTIPTYNYKLSRIVRRFIPARTSEFIEKKDCFFLKEVFLKGNSLYYEGYWQNEKYFKKISESIRELFSFKRELNVRNKSLYDFITSTKDAVGIHVRRGDYSQNPLYNGICEIDYYKEAISYILSQRGSSSFFIFSNDIGWCKEHFSYLLDGFYIKYIDWNKGEDSYIDMQLMSACNHNIISNSSFSWWAAWLNKNPDKIVVSPKKWLNKECGDIQLENWVKL